MSVILQFDIFIVHDYALLDSIDKQLLLPKVLGIVEKQYNPSFTVLVGK